MECEALIAFYETVVWKVQKYLKKKSINDVLATVGIEAKQRLLPWFKAAKVPYPPPRLALLGLKAEKSLELWAEKDGTWTLIRDYPILAASGILGPKLRQGDYQVPEGIYKLNFLNPNSNFHLSMQIDYPNDYDRRQAAKEQRTNLGGDIFIHGNSVSIGCLAMGDEAIEELFVLVATVGLSNVKVILAPQKEMFDLSEPVHAWIPELYASIRQALSEFKR
ncbi:hypothetical protein PN36_33975 [Candidatus Thiomargarita nelsonii]|uniref:L,D-TPase catalytic domain-containing protein n=1 Tax=Candidatus Thiomargarita nelsonii TaxID=1003181 RepID=A0A4E0QR73_9GAMM|nr:hypothetical protein PN36_33975 [Candidatus Thiomargarita nelsonii]